jgi:hypothetical protein
VTVVDRAVRVIVAGCWLGSGLTQLWDSAERLRTGADRQPHAEIPGDDPGRALAVLESCRSLVHGDVVLGVVGPGDVNHLFLHYRLAYELYPVRVASETYAPGEQRNAIAKVAAQRPRFVLVLGAPDASIPEARVAARPTPVDVLLISEGSRTAVADTP